MRDARLLILVAALGGWSRAAAQEVEAQPFLARALAAAERFREVSAAMMAGYRAVGPEIPAMGQHWIQPMLLNSSRVDPDQPPILEYATIGGHRVLVGVAYAVVVEPNEAPPELPISRRWWHQHSGDLTAESLSDSHAESGESDSDGVVVLHAWVPVTNPAGPFVAENWALPFLRAGLVPPAEISVSSARALALGTGALEHFLAQYRGHMHPDSAADALASASFTMGRDAVAAWLARRDPAAPLSPEEQDWLEDVWHRLEDQLISETMTRREE
jgi:hypothetical protein